MRFQPFLLLLLLLLLTPQAPLSAQEAVPDFQTVLAAQGWTNLAARVDFRVQRGDGPELPKEMQVFVEARAQGQDLYAEFTGPANMKGTAFLALTRTDLDDQHYLYVRTLRKVKRVQSYTDNFMLRDFLSLYLLKPRSELWRFGAGTCVQVEGRTLWRFEGTPAAPDTEARTGYARVAHFVDPTDRVIRRTEFFDGAGKLIRRQWVTTVQTIQGRPLATEFQTQDLGEGVAAKVKLLDPVLDSQPPADIFSVRRLKAL